MASTAARAYLAFGVLAVALNAALGGSTLLYDGIGLASAAAILFGTVINRPAAWRGWVILGASQALFAVGDLVYSASATSPSPADALYLGGDGLLIVAIIWLLVSPGRTRELTSHLDACLLALIVGVCGWALFATDAMTHGPLGARLVAVAYPIADLVLLAVLLRGIFVRGARAVSYWILLGAVLPLFMADGGVVMPTIDGSYQAGGWFDAGWLLSYVLFGVAALHPSMTRLVIPTTSGDTTLPVRRALVLGAGLIAVPVAMIVQDSTDARGAGGLGDEIALLVIAAGIVLRGAFLVRDLERLRRLSEQSERRFRMVFERAPIGISIGSNGIMSETNPALQRMLGYTGSEFAQMHYTDVTHPDDQDSTQQVELDAGNRDAFAIDKRYRRADGSYIEAHVNVALDIEDGLGISLIEDVTGRRELEDQLRQAQKMDSIGKLAGGIAHDFNNLMTAVIGYSDLLLQPGPDDRAREKVEAIRDSAVRASDLTRQLLAFSRRQILQTHDIDLRNVVQNMDTLLKRLIGEDVRLQTITGSEPVTVRADQTQLEQVVMNLAVNARDAMPEGGTLTIAVLAERGSAVLSVVDDGLGMDADTLAQIFEPFFTTKPLAEASGLGLSTVHGIVGQSGGTVQVESEPGEGTTFTIQLPLVRTPMFLPEVQGHATLVD